MLNFLLYDLLPIVFNMSLTAAIVILAVLAGRLLLQKAPKIFSYVLWSVVLFRLLCPVALSAEFSLFGLLDTSAADSTVLQYMQPGTVLPMQPDDMVLPGVTGGTVIPGTDGITGPAVGGNAVPGTSAGTAASLFTEPMAILSLLWFAGILTMVAVSLISFFKLHRSLTGHTLRDRSAEEELRLRGTRVYLTETIATPFVLGFLKPRIYLPASLSTQERTYILLHEQHHIRRLDHVVKLLAYLALCIHWFNPLVWMAFVLSSKDMEMSCDEAVIRNLGSDIRADYAASLLRLSAGRPVISAAPLAFGEGSAKSRIRNLQRWKRPKVWIAVLAGLLCLALLAACAVNPHILDNSSTGGRMETFETVRWRITVPSGLLEHYVVSDGTGFYDHCWQPAGQAGAVLTIQDLSRNVRDRLEELEGMGFTVDYDAQTASYETDKRYLYPIGDGGLYELCISTGDAALFAKLETAAESFTILETAGRAGMPTLPANMAEGTEHLYDFYFADRYTYRMNGIYSLYLPDGKLPDTKVLTLYQEFVNPVTNPKATSLMGQSIQSLSGDGMVPHDYKLYRYDFRDGLLQLETHFYEPDQLEYLSSIITTLPGASVAFGDPAQSSVAVGSSEEDLLLAFREHLYFLNTGSRQVTQYGELMMDRSGVPVEYDSLYFYQSYQNNDCRDITFYMKDGKVVCIEICSPFELRYVYRTPDLWPVPVVDGKKPFAQ